MTIEVDGMPIQVQFGSRNHNTILWYRADTKLDKETMSLCNFYSEQFGKVKFHKKKKIYNCKNGGWYVICQDQRCYMNDWKHKKEVIV